MTVGIVGGGQLARMMTLAGYPLGLDFLSLDRDAGTPAAQVAPALSGEFTDPALLDELARRSEVVTFDWENVPLAALDRIAGQVRIAPPRAALAAAQDRLNEKTLFDRLRHPDQPARRGRIARRARSRGRCARTAGRAEDAPPGL